MFSSYIPGIGSRDSKSARPAAGKRPSRKLQVEKLDERLALASVGVQSGVLVVVGTSGSDDIWVSHDYGRNYTVYLNNNLIGRVPKTSVYASTARIFGGQGNDEIGIDGSLPLRLDAYGGSGHDTIWGTRYNDILRGEGGDDKIYGKEGNDTIDGGAGNDVLSGGAGNDTIRGGDGNDTLYGDSGRDYLYGNLGADIFYDFDGDSVFDSGGNNRVLRGNRWIRF